MSHAHRKIPASSYQLHTIKVCSSPFLIKARRTFTCGLRWANTRATGQHILHYVSAGDTGLGWSAGGGQCPFFSVMVCWGRSILASDNYRINGNPITRERARQKDEIWGTMDNKHNGESVLRCPHAGTFSFWQTAPCLTQEIFAVWSHQSPGNSSLAHKALPSRWWLPPLSTDASASDEWLRCRWLKALMMAQIRGKGISSWCSVGVDSKRMKESSRKTVAIYLSSCAAQSQFWNGRYC